MFRSQAYCARIYGLKSELYYAPYLANMPQIPNILRYDWIDRSNAAATRLRIFPGYGAAAHHEIRHSEPRGRSVSTYYDFSSCKNRALLMDLLPSAVLRHVFGVQNLLLPADSRHKRFHGLEHGALLQLRLRHSDVKPLILALKDPLHCSRWRTLQPSLNVSL